MPFSSPIAPLNNDDAEYLMFLIRTIESQKWEVIWCALQGNPTAFQSFARKISSSSELNGMTILHACARFNPPVEIVKLLIELVPESPSLVDCLNRTPLHVAVGTRANFSSIRLLAGAYPEACAVLDEDGKTPLHLACDSACELFKGDESCEREPPSFDVVSMIASLCPWSVPLVNTYGISALEYAIISNAPIKIVHFLQKVTAEQTKNQKILQTAITRNYRVI